MKVVQNRLLLITYLHLIYTEENKYYDIIKKILSSIINNSLHG